MAPIVDLNSNRRVPWTSWSALVLSLAALLVATSHRADLRLSALALVDIIIYLGATFVRLHFMSRLAKNESKEDARAYFVEEQMTAGPVALGVVILLALVLPAGGAGDQLRSGLVDVMASGQRWVVVLVGLFSLGTGVFGTLVYLDARENSFTVPVNRAANVLAGVAATFALQALTRTTRVDLGELAGAALVILAIVLLAWPMRFKHRTLAGWAPRLPPEK
jgi:Ca2+/Na+ antiporter